MRPFCSPCVSSGSASLRPLAAPAAPPAMSTFGPWGAGPPVFFPSLLLLLCSSDRNTSRIAHITAMLQQSLGGLLLEGLQTSNVDIIRHCLQTYATIDKTRDAEALVGQLLVKPYMDEVIVEQIVESHPDGLKIMYASKLLEFVPHHCRLLREVTGGAISSPQLSHLSRALQPS
ncbi:conserved oligomeric Golgi complex subunit 2-like isoform X4 [Mustela putorius furo]|uniref:Conserved oligomeric Golgi complex subunit 2-like isoform X4 n=2 Tax=Mustela putorius furo TaxID=9669 RepID=A0A8U0RF03_MUSPF|nr:conserved oligomeric Golgi complex subunit 2-like isoform X4 [Mustela putorius furo]XP_044923138.1 conserved oligomeric Golgi complex subunit 2-like isoform X4 [Mustela putorius furo]XP_044923140.1 conserved oligomeric Golgi complex subunit 2-like isoform X4 [Mustela putorius furo]XP_044923141.1 conserved oligomeric Golgi complex subunit 2-like isoform X4 [Mustela putorius furo]